MRSNLLWVYIKQSQFFDRHFLADKIPWKWKVQSNILYKKYVFQCSAKKWTLISRTFYIDSITTSHFYAISCDQIVVLSYLSISTLSILDIHKFWNSAVWANSAKLSAVFPPLIPNWKYVFLFITSIRRGWCTKTH